MADLLPRLDAIECYSDDELTTLHEAIHLEWRARYPGADFPDREIKERRSELRREARGSEWLRRGAPGAKP